MVAGGPFPTVGPTQHIKVIVSPPVVKFNLLHFLGWQVRSDRAAQGERQAYFLFVCTLGHSALGPLWLKLLYFADALVPTFMETHFFPPVSAKSFHDLLFPISKIPWNVAVKLLNAWISFFFLIPLLNKSSPHCSACQIFTVVSQLLGDGWWTCYEQAIALKYFFFLQPQYRQSSWWVCQSRKRFPGFMFSFHFIFRGSDFFVQWNSMQVQGLGNPNRCECDCCLPALWQPKPGDLSPPPLRQASTICKPEWSRTIACRWLMENGISSC